MQTTDKEKLAIFTEKWRLSINWEVETKYLHNKLRISFFPINLFNIHIVRKSTWSSKILLRYNCYLLVTFPSGTVKILKAMSILHAVYYFYHQEHLKLFGMSADQGVGDGRVMEKIINDNELNAIWELCVTPDNPCSKLYKISLRQTSWHSLVKIQLKM